ncbi:hypothetical protein Fmac_008825 [Flemingia macrophylla]|uniref:RING-type E3 ubiquitin transferase n=1 Tax=Flemingia macrophylla TaxID=520843 RepID=A0ABD1MYI3_9FABA
MAPNNPTADRRSPLWLPTVRPCAGISPAAILASLITLAEAITSQCPSDSLATQRRNAAEASRQVSILLLLFQDLYDQAAACAVPRPFLSELHVTLQKLHLLMQDCSRHGARLFMLSNSRHAASLFRQQIRAIAASLEMLPLGCVDVSGEVKELVELLTRQAKRARLQLHQNDERHTKRLHFILDQLQSGAEPDVDSMKTVLHYVGITTWSVCNSEVEFLEEELEYSSEEGDVSLLSSLVGCLCYSRVVIFENSDYLQCRTTTEEISQHDPDTLACVVPEEFRCPISLEIMTDPVTISTGQTYNRDSITKWFRQGNMTCPKTRETLTNTQLLPNTTLKKLIQKFCANNGVAIGNSTDRDHRAEIRTTQPGSPVAAHAMQFLSWFISRRLVFGTDEQKSKAAYEIQLLAKSNVFNRVCLVEMGTVGPLLDLLGTDDKVAQENAINALMKLAMDRSGVTFIMESRGLVPILNVLKRGLTLESRHVAIAVISYLSSSKELRKIMGESGELIPALVEAVKEGTLTLKRNAVVAIFGLLIRRNNVSKVLAAGAVPALVNVLASCSDSRELVTDSLVVLAALADSVEGARAAFRAKAFPLVAGILKSAASRTAKEYCSSILHSLCISVGEEVIGVLAKDSSIMPSLYNLITHGTPYASTNGRSLINFVMDFTEKRYHRRKVSE